MAKLSPPKSKRLKRKYEQRQQGDASKICMLVEKST